LELGERQISNTADASDFDRKQAETHADININLVYRNNWKMRPDRVSVEIKGDKSREKILRVVVLVVVKKL